MGINVLHAFTIYRNISFVSTFKIYIINKSVFRFEFHVIKVLKIIYQCDFRGGFLGKGNGWKWKKRKVHNRLVPKFKYYIRKISKF